MANLIESEDWEAGIYQLETEDPVLGGEDGIDNLQAKQLANRTAYLKAQLLLRALIASPEFTGVPKAPTAAPGTNTMQIASTAFTKTAIDNAIAALVDSSPGALDTLNELAAALGDDANFATTVTNALALKAPLASPALTGNPTAPTQAAGDDSTKLATTAFVKANISPDASEIVKGLLEIATDGEAQSFMANKAIDGAKLNSAFKGANQSLASPGYQKLPGGLILQWGDFTWVRTSAGTMTVNFPVTFPNAILQVLLTDSGSGTGSTGAQAWRIDLSSTSLFGAYSAAANPSVDVGQSQFFAIGK